MIFKQRRNLLYEVLLIFWALHKIYDFLKIFFEGDLDLLIKIFHQDKGHIFLISILNGNIHLSWLRNKSQLYPFVFSKYVNKW